MLYYILYKYIKYVYTIYQQIIYRKDLFRNIYWQKQIQKDNKVLKQNYTM